jgi:hypothetical protein
MGGLLFMAVMIGAWAGYIYEIIHIRSEAQRTR